MLGPLGVLALVLGGKKRKSKADVLLFVLVFAVASGMTLTACNSNPPAGNVTATGVVTPVAGGVIATGTATFSNGATATGTMLVPSGTPVPTLTATCTPTPTPSSTIIQSRIVGFPNIIIGNPQDWSAAEIAELTSILKDKILPAFGNSLGKFIKAVGMITVNVVLDHSLTVNGKGALARSPFDIINFEHRIFSPLNAFGIIHEFGHQFDWQGHESDAEKLQWRSQQFVDNPAINLNIAQCTDRLQCRNIYKDQNNNGLIYPPSEAYANAFAAYILGPSSPHQYQVEKLTIIQNDIQGVKVFQ